MDWSSCRLPFAEPGSVAQITPADATYVDDITLRAFAVRATDATRITSLIASIALTVLYNAGLYPNMTIGKTQALISFFGQGSRDSAIDLYVTNDCVIPVIVADQPVDLHVALNYKYLGSFIDHKLSRRKDIAHRATQYNMLSHSSCSTRECLRFQASNSMHVESFVSRCL